MHANRIVERVLWTLLVLTLHCAALQAGPVEERALVGRWYGELANEGAYEGKTYDMRRWISTRNADRTGQTVMRYYLKGNVQTESVETVRWSYVDGLLTTECVSVTDHTGKRECKGGTTYRITQLAASELIYASERSGLSYRALKVAKDYKLP